MAFWNKDQSGQPTVNGLPGVQPQEPEVDAALLTMPTAQRAIGTDEVRKATETLMKYKSCKANLESRVVEDELWYKLQHWEIIRRKQTEKDKTPRPEPTSAWLFNSIMNKHADAMDNFPEPNVLPREMGDEQDAKTLSSILPVILEYNEFEETYSDNWWEKLKHGTGVYGVFWNSQKENGLGDIDIKGIDLLNLFWEPGIDDIQKSRNVFVVDMVDDDLLEDEYPQLKGKLGGNSIDVKQYVYDDTVDTTGKSVVVDWYYKVRAANGRTLLHYAKFVGDTLLFASENEQEYTERGWYDHGQYPFVFDVMYPEKGTPCGFGYVALERSPQLYIDKLSQNILEYSGLATRARYFASSSSGVNEDEFLDSSKPLVHVEGSLDEKHLRQIEMGTLDSIYVSILQMKIDELKETSANRDVSQGGTGGGVTAAAAIAALQEAGNKGSRDMIGASYRAYTKIDNFCIELVRQFYDEARSFRITGQVPGQMEFVEYSNQNLKDQPLGMDSTGNPMVRRPVFDIKIKAQKKNPFSRASQNELAKELYGMGFFNPDRAQEAQGALELMEFEGKDKVVEQVRQGQTLLNIVEQMSAKMDQMAMVIQAATGMDMGLGQTAGGGAAGGAAMNAPAASGKSGGVEGELAQAQKVAMTGYGASLAARSVPSAGDTGKVGAG